MIKEARPHPMAVWSDDQLWKVSLSAAIVLFVIALATVSSASSKEASATFLGAPRAM